MRATKVARRLETEPAGIARKRSLAIHHGLRGELNLDEIAQLLGRSRSTIQRWFDTYRQEGLERLCCNSTGKRGPQSRLHAKARQELLKKMHKGSFRRIEDARQWLASAHGIKASNRAVGYWMGKLGARLKVVRPRHPGSDQSQCARFKSQLARLIFQAVGERGHQLKDRFFRIWIADEGRFGLQPCHRRAWGLRGVRAHKSSRCQCAWQYVWAALRVGSGGTEFFYTDHVDQEISLEFLRQISQRDPQAMHAVIWDGTGFHPRNNDARLPENIVLIKRPAYSPELNPVEKLWDQLRDAVCNRQWSELDELMEHSTRWLKNFWENPRRTYALIGSGWLLLQAKDC